ncbi:MAG: prolipoprotein diacylglyceryl transferase [Parachlamydiaceae bacterium]
MQFLSCLGVIHWDPHPDLFTIPLIHHPLKWYGLLFVTGLIAGFFILLPLVKQKLLRTLFLQERDVFNWKNLQEALSSAIHDASDPLHPYIINLDRSTKFLLKKNTLSEPTKKTILTELSKIPRIELESMLPGSITPIKDLSYKYVDGLLWWIVLGTIVGARLGHVFFYDWTRYANNWVEILKIWEGGLASHGGTIGVLLAVFGYTFWRRKEFPEIRFLDLTDLLCIPTAFAVVFIRLGNFINQEILGNPTTASWGIIFGHPADNSLPIPRHPVQLYEAIAYFLTFVLLAALWRLKKQLWPSGFITGLLFVCIFGSRFFLEFYKAPQGTILNETYLQVGQILSLPFIFLGIALMYFSQRVYK